MRDRERVGEEEDDLEEEEELGSLLAGKEAGLCYLQGAEQPQTLGGCC